MMKKPVLNRQSSVDHHVSMGNVNAFEKSLKGKGDEKMSIASTKGSIHLPVENQSRNVMKLNKVISRTYDDMPV
jgi:uncharacterized membrane protein